MFDAKLRLLIDPPLNAVGRSIAKLGISADQVTFIGFLVGLLSFGAITLGWFWLGLLFLAFNRIADGLDGAVARATTMTSRGGFLDIAFDFLFYALVPLGFAIADPTQNALPACILIASFVGTGSSFLAFAISAEKQGLSTEAQGQKSFYYLEGLTEGTETIACLALMCLFPSWFPVLALIYAALCFITTGMRIHRGWQTL